MATVAGRGAWTSVGTGSSVTDYELTTPNVGLAWSVDTGLNFNFHAVNSGVQAIQTLVNAQGYEPALVIDGVFGPLTAAGVKFLQGRLGVTTDGDFGPISARAAFSPIALAIEVELKIPNHYLCGQIDVESTFDPGAVGVVTTYGIDQGIAQINSVSYPTVPWLRCFDPNYAISLAGQTLASSYMQLKNMDAAIASWNNPALAQEWAKTGAAPDAQIAAYVALVKARASTF